MGQFKSKNTIGKLVQATDTVLGRDNNDIKNRSDTLGGIFKTALRRTLQMILVLP